MFNSCLRFIYIDDIDLREPKSAFLLLIFNQSHFLFYISHIVYLLAMQSEQKIIRGLQKILIFTWLFMINCLLKVL